MNIFRRIWNKITGRGNAQNAQEIHQDVRSMNDVSFLEWLGIKRRSKKPTSEVTYFTCLKMMSETLAKMPIKYFQKTDHGIIEPPETDISRLLRNRPNPFMTPTVFWNTVEMNRCHFGNAYLATLETPATKMIMQSLSAIELGMEEIALGMEV